MKQKGDKMILSVGLPRDAAARLQALAQTQERSVSWLGARFIMRELARHEETENTTTTN